VDDIKLSADVFDYDYVLTLWIFTSICRWRGQIYQWICQKTFQKHLPYLFYFCYEIDWFYINYCKK